MKVDVCWAGQAVVIKGLYYLSSTGKQEPWYLGASVMLTSWRGRVRNGLKYGVRLRLHQVRWGVSVQRSVEQQKRVSLYPLLPTPQ